MKRRKPLRSHPDTTRAWKERSRREKPLSRETPINPINRERRKRERGRAYGPEARREFVTRQLPCVGCGKRPTERHPNHQHHTKSGGTGRKADADTIVPLCSICHRREHDGHGPDVEWGTEARRTEAAWREHQRQGGG